MDAAYRLATSPVARPGAVHQGDRWRITVLADGLVRLEWAADGRFEDRASMLALHRDLPVPSFRVDEFPAYLQVVTERLVLTYDRGPFSPAGLSVQVRGNVSTYHSVWRFGDLPTDLGGTARTLDDVDGRAPLEPGVVSRQGFAALDDSRSLLLSDDGWVEPRDGSRTDLYVFAYGHDHQAALDALYALSGKPPVLPRWALGNWWSRYHAYTAAEYLELLNRFDVEGIPFSVAVLDMDWHPVAGVDPVYGSGWTGYSWNRELFPDPIAFLAELHRRGYRVTLNVHPADGVRPFEDAYSAMARALGRDPADQQPIAFDVTDPAFVEAYFKVLHRPLEHDGVDFWWIDWQSGPYSRVPGIDPLWMLNHFHFLDSGRDGRRPITFSRYAGPGSHRYPVGFSGDTVISWASLDFQPEFTATASNIGYGWWSHDVGGHMFGARDDELALRWLQLGVFSPILRLHSSNNPFLVKEPWQFGAETAQAMKAALRFRHRLVPYLHSMNHRAADDGLPLVRPMYHLFPETDAAYRVPNQFAFGSQLLVAPITIPRDGVTLRGSVGAWLPKGIWIDIFTEYVYDGDRMVQFHRDDHSVPVLLPAGGVLVLAAADQLDAAGHPEHFEILVAPGADGRFDLVEDDGTGASLPATTTISWEQASGTLTVGAATGATGFLPQHRTWTVTVLGVGRAPGTAGPPLADGSSGRLGHVVAGAPTDSIREIVLAPDLQPRTVDPSGRLLELLERSQHNFEAKATAWATLQSDRSTASKLAAVAAQGLPDALFGAITELLTLHV